jgi:hypothetical protein
MISVPKLKPYREYRKTGSVEAIKRLHDRNGFCSSILVNVIGTSAGQAYLFAWYSAVLISTGLILNFNWRGHGGKFQKIKMPCSEADARARHPISISMVISLLGGTVIVTSTHFPQKWPFAWLDRYGVS